MVIHLENPLSETLKIIFPESLIVDLYVRSVKGPDAGREVYRWSEGQVIMVKPNLDAVEPRTRSHLLIFLDPPAPRTPRPTSSRPNTVLWRS